MWLNIYADTAWRNLQGNLLLLEWQERFPPRTHAAKPMFCQDFCSGKINLVMTVNNEISIGDRVGLLYIHLISSFHCKMKLGSWIESLFCIGVRRPLYQSDLFAHPPESDSRHLLNKFNRFGLHSSINTSYDNECRRSIAVEYGRWQKFNSNILMRNCSRLYRIHKITEHINL